MKKMMMIAAMIVATMTASAQNAIFEPGTFSLQPKVGVNVSQVSGDNIDFKAGLAAGFEGQYQVNNWFGVSAGIMYEQQGFKPKHGEKFNTEYINVPVLAKFYPVKGLSLNVGVQPGFLTKAKQDGADMKDACNKFDFSIPVSVAYEFPFGMVLEARFTDGITNVFKSNAFNGKSSSYEVDKNHNQVFQLTVGYKFGL